MSFAWEYMTGAKTTIWLLFASKDECQPLEFMENLGERERKKVAALLEYTTENGPHRDETRFKHLGGQIFEFKPYGIRLLCFRTDSGYVVVRGHDKSKKRLTQREIAKARDLREAFFNDGEHYVGQTE